MGINIKHDNGDDEAEDLMPEINITPFVDVMLVLLIVFMITAPMLSAGVPVELPDSQAAALKTEDEAPIEITLKTNGDIYIADTEVTRDKMLAVLSESTKSNKDARIYIRADKVLDYGRVMDILGAINKAGYTKVALLSQPVSP